MKIFIDDINTPAKTTVETAIIVNDKIETRVVPNPDFQKWRTLDQALLGWLLSSISKDIHTKVTKAFVSLKSSQLWNSLEKLFGS